MENEVLHRAMKGDINSFHLLFSEFKEDLKTYLYRLLADRNDTEDLTHDTFVKAFDKLSSFKAQSNLKTWVFAIATNLAYDFLKSRKRWASDILDQAKEKAGEYDYVKGYLKKAAADPNGAFELKEHIDFCFTCISKTIPLEQQIAIMLIDIYDFKVKEAAQIMGKGEAAVKHYIRFARRTMIEVYDNRCALINKKGVCHQCSELNNWLNPKRSFQLQKMEIEWIGSSGSDKKELFKLRETLIKNIHPLKAKGSHLHEAFMKLHRLCAGEIESL